MVPEMPESAIVVGGDKGDVARQVNRQVLLIDDKETNSGRVTAVPGKQGLMVRRGQAGLSAIQMSG